MTMLVKHIRDDWGKPFGTIVAINGDDGVKMGVSFCHETKENFSRKRGTQIALGRAKIGNSNKQLIDVGGNVYVGSIPNRREHFYVRDGGTGFSKYMEVSDILKNEIERMRDRAKRYYKPELTYEPELEKCEL